MNDMNYKILTLSISTASLLVALIPNIFSIAKYYLNALKVLLCDKVACSSDNKASIKLINISPRASANNLNVSFKIINKRTNIAYNINGFSEANLRLSSNNLNNNEYDNEITILVDVMSINRSSIYKSGNTKIIKQYETKKLKLLDLLDDDEAYLFVEINAVNELTGKICCFPAKKYYRKDVIYGFFAKGDSMIHQANKITSKPNDHNN